MERLIEGEGGEGDLGKTFLALLHTLDLSNYVIMTISPSSSLSSVQRRSAEAEVKKAQGNELFAKGGVSNSSGEGRRERRRERRKGKGRRERREEKAQSNLHCKCCEVFLSSSRFSYSLPSTPTPFCSGTHDVLGAPKFIISNTCHKASSLLSSLPSARNAILVIVTGLIAYITVKAGDTSSLSVIGALPSGMPSVGAPDLSWSSMGVSE